MLKIETMTLCELAVRMRQLGVPTSNERLAAGIEAGVYPFAICIRTPEGKHRIFEIYTKLFDKWVAERATDDGGAA